MFLLSLHFKMDNAGQTEETRVFKFLLTFCGNKTLTKL